MESETTKVEMMGSNNNRGKSSAWGQGKIGKLKQREGEGKVAKTGKGRTEGSNKIIIPHTSGKYNSQ